MQDDMDRAECTASRRAARGREPAAAATAVCGPVQDVWGYWWADRTAESAFGRTLPADAPGADAAANAGAEAGRWCTLRRGAGAARERAEQSGRWAQSPLGAGAASPDADGGR